MYKGMVYYSLSYTLFIAIEFSVFEAILVYLEKHFPIRDFSSSTDGEKKLKARDHSYIHIVTASFLAGSIGGFLTNSVEFLAVNKQINEDFSIKKILKTKGIVREMLFKGMLYRSFYYGSSAVAFFSMFQEFSMHLNVDITLDE